MRNIIQQKEFYEIKEQTKHFPTEHFNKTPIKYEKRLSTWVKLLISSFIILTLVTSTKLILKNNKNEAYIQALVQHQKKLQKQNERTTELIEGLQDSQYKLLKTMQDKDNQDYYKARAKVEGLEKIETKMHNRLIEINKDLMAKQAQYKQELERLRKDVNSYSNVFTQIQPNINFSSKVLPFNQVNEDILFQSHQMKVRQLSKIQQQELNDLLASSEFQNQVDPTLVENLKSKHELERYALRRNLGEMRRQFRTQGYLKVSN